MPRIADYVVIRRAAFDLAPGHDSGAMTFTINSDMVLNRADSAPVISYQCRPLSDQSVDLRIDISGDTIEHVDIAVNTVRAMWKTFDATFLHPGPTADNNIKFRNAGGGAIRISDVIVWFQRDVP